MPQPKRTRLFAPGSSSSASPMRRSAVSGLAARRPAAGSKVLEQRRRRLDVQDGMALEQDRAVEHAPQPLAVGGEVGPEPEVRIEGDHGHAVVLAQAVEHLARAARASAGSPSMRERSRSFWKKKTMSRPRGGGGAPACRAAAVTAGSGGVSSATQVTDSTGTSRPSTFSRKSRGARPRIGRPAPSTTRASTTTLSTSTRSRKRMSAGPAPTAVAARPRSRTSAARARETPHAGTSRM